MARKPYETDLTDGQWDRVVQFNPAGQARRAAPARSSCGRSSTAGVYLNRTGCSWRLLPHDLPPWGTVHYYHRRFRIDGVWDQIHDRLREDVRVAAGKNPTASAAVVDSQSVKTTGKGGYTGTTRARRSTAASGTSPSTRRG